MDGMGHGIYLESYLWHESRGRKPQKSTSVFTWIYPPVAPKRYKYIQIQIYTQEKKT